MFTKLAQPKAVPSRRGISVNGLSSPGRISPTKPAASVSSPTRSKASPLLDLDQHLRKRDFAAALTLLRVQQRQQQEQQQQEKKSTGSLRSQAAVPDVRFWRRNTWWTAYCDFQRGDINSALAGFNLLLEEEDDEASVDGESKTTARHEDPFMARDKLAWHISRACCLFYLREFDSAEQETMRLPRDTLCNRLLFLLAHEKTRQTHDESSSESTLLMDRYSRLAPHSSPRDQLAVAFTSFSRRNYTEAVDAYKSLLTSIATSRDGSNAAVHVYLALCYYHLEYFDVAAELLSAYLEANPGSFFAINVKASCHFRLYGADAALSILSDFAAQFPHHPAAAPLDTTSATIINGTTSLPLLDVVDHNHAVFSESQANTSGAPAGPAESSTSAPASIETKLKRLSDGLPEARLNLALLYLRNHSLPRAQQLLEDVEPATDVERMIKGALFALVGEEHSTRDHSFLAEKLFHVRPVLPVNCVSDISLLTSILVSVIVQAVGSSPDSVDTIPGRQNMASYFILRREFADALVYLESISTYLSPSSAAFNWNYGLCLAVVASSDATDSATSIKYYLQAQECLERARTLSRQLANDITLICWLARCYIRGNVSNNAINGSHVHAWELFLEMERSAPLMDARAMLKIVANDYYITRRFFLAARAFDALERLENSVDPELWEAKRGACVGFFRQVATGEERDSPGNGMKTRAVVPPLLSTRVDEMLSLLARSTNVLEASKLTAMLKKWVVSLKLR